MSIITLKVPYSRTEEMRSIPGARYDKAQGQWVLPVSQQTHVALHDGPSPLNLKQEARRVDDRPISRMPELYPYQTAGVRFMASGSYVLNADEMGTGKTIQTLATIELEQAYPALIVAPKAILHNWAREVHRWTAATPIVVEGTAAQRRKSIEAARHTAEPVVVIINYESLVKHTKQAPFGNVVLSEEKKREKELNDIAWSTVVVDEAHRIKNPKADNTRAVWGVSESAAYRFALTGTPIVNNPDDLWSILRFVDPTAFPSRSRFRTRYCHIRPGWHGGIENLGIRETSRDEFDMLTRPYIIRRTKAEVLPQLPEKIVSNIYLDLDRHQDKAYRDMVEVMMAQVKAGTLFATDPLTLVGRLRYIACALPEVDEKGNVTSLHGGNKLAYIKALLEDSGDEPLVVYAQSRKLIELFERELDDHVSVHGNVTAKMRQHNIDRFMGGDARVLLATTGAGAEGLTLTRANRLVVAMEDWSNVKNKQAHDRIHRIGQERGVEIITLVSRGTIEEAVSKATDRKENMLQQLVRDEEALMQAVRGG